MLQTRVLAVAGVLFVCLALPGCSGDKRAEMAEARAHYEAGAAYLNQRLYDRALEEFNQAIALDPGHAEAYCDRGISLMMKADSQAALRDFDLAVEKDPTLAKAHFHRGFILERDGKTAEAIEAYEAFMRHSQLKGTAPAPSR